MAAFTTEIDIANLALDLMDEAEIQSLTENNPAARALNRQIQKSRDIVLHESQWKFAQRTKGVSNDASAPDAPGYSKQSSLPGDCIFLISVHDGDPDIEDALPPLPEEYWDLEGRKLLHNLEDGATVRYISNAASYGGTVSNWSPKAAEAWAHHLAYTTAKKITGSRDVAQSLRQAYIQDALPTAQLKEGHQGRVKENLGMRHRLMRSPLVRSRWTNRIPSQTD